MSRNSRGVIAALALAGALVLTGCGSDDPDQADVTGSPTSQTADPTPEPPATPTSPADLVLAPGAAGPVKVGMTKAEAIATGVLEAGPESDVEGCPAPALVWATAFDGTLDVLALESGEVASIGVWKPGPKTASGLGVGSTYADVLAAHPGSKGVTAGFDQTGVLVHDDATDGWIGYLFDTESADVTDTSEVSFIELTRGEEPSVIRDGC